MLTKTKAKSALKMLITLFLTLALILGIYFAIPKQKTQVSAATTGSSAILKGYTSVTHEGSTTTSSGSSWLNKLASPVTKDNITSIRITTDSSKIVGFTQGVNVKDDSSQNALYYYYKANSSDSSKYDIVIYADVEIIYAPVCCYHLFNNLTNCKSIVFDNFNTSNVTNMSSMFYNDSSLTSLDLSNFDTSNVTDMEYMFLSCSSLTSLDLSNFNTSNVTKMSEMFEGCQALKTLDISSFSFDSITNADNVQGMLGVGYDFLAQISAGFDVDAFRRADDAGKMQMLIDAGIASDEEEAQLYLSAFSEPTTIIAPATIPNGLEISLPGKYNVDGKEEPVTTLQEGKTHTLAGASSDTSETGVISDSILLSLITLCFVFSGFMLLKRKKVR